MIVRFVVICGIVYHICIHSLFTILHFIDYYRGASQGRIQDFKLGGAYLKKLRRAEGGANIFGVFRVKIRDFTPKKQITESPSYP